MMNIIIGILFVGYIPPAMIFILAGISYENKETGGSYSVALIFGLVWPLMVLHYLTVLYRR